jgi:hypothetical protein
VLPNVSARRLSSSAASCDLICPTTDSRACAAVVRSWTCVSGRFSNSTNWLTIDLTSSPLPTPGEEIVAMAAPYSTKTKRLKRLQCARKPLV